MEELVNQNIVRIREKGQLLFILSFRMVFFLRVTGILCFICKSTIFVIPKGNNDDLIVLIVPCS